MKNIFTSVMLLLIMVLFRLPLSGQLHVPRNYAKWAIGEKVTVDLATTTPRLRKGEVQLYSRGETATFCDSLGQILLTTDGDTVWNGQGKVVKGGDKLHSCSSDSFLQGVLILPKPGNKNEFYIFTYDEEYRFVYSLKYAIFHKKKQNNNGEITVKNKKISQWYLPDYLPRGAITAVQSADKKFWWLIAFGDSNKLFSYKFDENGIDSVGKELKYFTKTVDRILNWWDVDRLLFAPNGKTLSYYKYVFDFDNVKGDILPHHFDIQNTNQNKVFSADSRKLHISGEYTIHFQIPEFPAFGEKKLTGQAGYYNMDTLVWMNSYPKLGKDGIIYFGQFYSDSSKVDKLFFNPNRKKYKHYYLGRIPNSDYFSKNILYIREPYDSRLDSVQNYPFDTSDWKDYSFNYYTYFGTLSKRHYNYHRGFLGNQPSDYFQAYITTAHKCDTTYAYAGFYYPADSFYWFYTDTTTKITKKVHSGRIRLPDDTGHIIKLQLVYFNRLVPDTLTQYINFDNIPRSPRERFFKTKDTSMCYNDSLHFIGKDKSLTYIWDNQFKTTEYTVYYKNDYLKVKMINDCGFMEDSLLIKTYDYINKFSDVNLKTCDTVPLTLVPKFPDKTGITYQWNGTNAYQYSSRATFTGKYYVDIFNKCFKERQYFNVEFFPPKPKLDTLYKKCPEKTITLGKSSLGYKFFWSNGDTFPQILLKSEGRFFRTSYSPCNNQITNDTFKIVNEIVPQSIPRQNRAVCVLGKESLILGQDSSIHYNYLWMHNNSIKPKISVQKTGEYYLKKHNKCITTFDTFNILPYALPYQKEIISLCDVDSFIIPLQTKYSYKWMDSFPNTNQRIITKGGKYIRRINDAKCFSYDTFIIHPCFISSMIVPNAFTPNNDGINDEFLPLLNFTPNLYQLSIYNRWGEKLFSTTSINHGWNGQYLGKTVDFGVYYYQLYTDMTKLKSGTVMVVK